MQIYTLLVRTGRSNINPLSFIICQKIFATDKNFVMNA